MVIRSLHAGRLLPFIVATLLAADPASAQDVAERCVEAHFQGQVERQRGALLQARRLFGECARPTCPEIVRADCAVLLAEAQAATPTVVFTALDETGHDLAHAAVRLGSSAARLPVDGRAVALDPGHHQVTVEANGYFARTISLVLREGEKRRPVVVRLNAVEAVREPREDTGGLHPLTYVFGGIGVLAAGSWAYFGISGLSKRAGCNDGEPCAAEVNTHLLVADVSFLVSMASFGAGSYFLFAQPDREAEPRRPRKAKRSVRLSSEVTPSSAQVAVSGQF